MSDALTQCAVTSLADNVQEPVPPAFGLASAGEAARGASPAPDGRVAPRTQQILAAITDPLVVYGPDWTIQFLNDAASTGFGAPPAQLLGKRVWDLLPVAVGTPFHRELERAMQERVAVSIEDHFALDGRWYELRAYPLPDGGLVVYSRDVTARRREEDLRGRLAVYAALRADIATALGREREIAPMLQSCCEAIVRNLPLAFARIWLADGREEALELKASAGLYTHLDGAHARVPIGAFKIGLIAAERQPHLSNSVLEDERVSNKDWARREGMVSFAGYPLLSDGRLVGVLAGFARVPLPDDTLSALANASDAIAHGVERRRAEIELDLRARDLARSNADLEQFAYVASHDLQEPLRMVASYNQLLRRRYKGKLDADADEFIDYSVEGATRMQRLINDLLTYSRVGTRGVEHLPVEMERVLGTALSNLTQAIAETGATVTHDPLPTLVGDQAQLVQLLQNLVGNAIKFHGEEPPRVHVGATAGPDAWCFSVADNGVGIDPQYFERIFVIFQRLHPREKYPGTGIGLAICKKVVERHGGRIWVESQPGKGATVFFTVPHRSRNQRRSS